LIEPAIVNGAPSGDAENATVLVMHYDALAKGGGAASACTGSLLAPTLVLTARHCVAVTDDGAACDRRGNPIAGGAVTGDHAPGALYVFGGRARPNFLDGTARPSRGVEILTPASKNLCNADIALVVLDRPVEGADITPVRLEATTAPGEVVTVVGWGISESEPNPATRRSRADVAILRVGPAEALSPAELLLGEGTCQGDSGGPAVAASGAVVGVLSRGGNGARAIGADRCLGATNVFTSAAAYADLLREGYTRVGQNPWVEGAPDPRLVTSVSATGGGCRAASVPSATCAEAVFIGAVLLACAWRKRRVGTWI